MCFQEDHQLKVTQKAARRDFTELAIGRDRQSHLCNYQDRLPSAGAHLCPRLLRQAGPPTTGRLCQRPRAKVQPLRDSQPPARQCCAVGQSAKLRHRHRALHRSHAAVGTRKQPFDRHVFRHVLDH